jgi:alpha-L-arabinofuranosidase
MDGLSLHNYLLPGSWLSKGSATEFDESAGDSIMKKAVAIYGMIAKHAGIMGSYVEEKRVGLIVDEWGTWHDPKPGTNPGFLDQQNTLRDAPAAGTVRNIFNNHCDRVPTANIAQTVNVLQAMVLTRGPEMILPPTYNVFEMNRPHQDAISPPLRLTSEPYAYGGNPFPPSTHPLRAARTGARSRPFATSIPTGGGRSGAIWADGKRRAFPAGSSPPVR